VAEVKSLTDGRGADCVIVAVASKSSAPVQQAIEMCRERGRLVIVGACPLDLSRDMMYVKDLRLLMARAYGPGSYDRNTKSKALIIRLPLFAGRKIEIWKNFCGF